LHVLKFNTLLRFEDMIGPCHTTPSESHRLELANRTVKKPFRPGIYSKPFHNGTNKDIMFGGAWFPFQYSPHDTTHDAA